MISVLGLAPPLKLQRTRAADSEIIVSLIYESIFQTKVMLRDIPASWLCSINDFFSSPLRQLYRLEKFQQRNIQRFANNNQLFQTDVLAVFPTIVGGTVELVVVGKILRAFITFLDPEPANGRTDAEHRVSHVGIGDECFDLLF